MECMWLGKRNYAELVQWTSSLPNSSLWYIFTSDQNQNQNAESKNILGKYEEQTECLIIYLSFALCSCIDAKYVQCTQYFDPDLETLEACTIEEGVTKKWSDH